MRFSLITVLYACLFAHTVFAQSSFMVSDMEAPVLDENPVEPVPEFFFQHPLPQPSAPTASQEQSATDESKITEDRYRATIKSLAGKKGKFVHCKLKNGKVLTGTVHDAGYEAFTLHSKILSEGTRIYYKDLAEASGPVPAVGTRFKQGAQWVGFAALIALAIPAIILFSPVLFANGIRC